MRAGGSTIEFAFIEEIPTIHDDLPDVGEDDDDPTRAETSHEDRWAPATTRGSASGDEGKPDEVGDGLRVPAGL